MPRLLLAHEWERLRPIFASEGQPLPPWTGLPTLIEEDQQGQIIAVLLLHQALPQLEAWTAPEHRGNGLIRTLAEHLKPLLDDEGPYMAFCRDERMSELCAKMGMLPQNGIMFMMEPNGGS